MQGNKGVPLSPIPHSPSPIPYPLLPIPCLEKVLDLGKPQERTFRYPLFPTPYPLWQNASCHITSIPIVDFTGIFKNY